jgi:hypothetical protein
MYDWVDHGEFVARVAAGKDYGVAKNAGLYIIKYKNAFISPTTGNLVTAPAVPSAIDTAFVEALFDALTTFQGVNTKAVINFSAGMSHVISYVENAD